MFKFTREQFHITSFAVTSILLLFTVVYLYFDGGILRAQNYTTVTFDKHIDGFEALSRMCDDDNITISVRSEESLSKPSTRKLLFSTVRIKCNNISLTKSVRHTPPMLSKDLNVDIYLADVEISDVSSQKAVARIRTINEVGDAMDFLKRFFDAHLDVFLWEKGAHANI